LVTLNYIGNFLEWNLRDLNSKYSASKFKQCLHFARDYLDQTQDAHKIEEFCTALVTNSMFKEKSLWEELLPYFTRFGLTIFGILSVMFEIRVYQHFKEQMKKHRRIQKR
jgi:hypothetical protein